MPLPDVAEARDSSRRYRLPRHGCKLTPVTIPSRGIPCVSFFHRCCDVVLCASGCTGHEAVKSVWFSLHPAEWLWTAAQTDGKITLGRMGILKGNLSLY